MSVKNLITRALASNIRARCSRFYSNGTSTYEGDGKTTVHVLNKELELGLMINAFSQAGFRLNNGIFVLGPMAIFPRTVLSWNISHYEEINDKTLSLFTVLEPKIDVLVVGTGDQPITPKFSNNIIAFMRKYGINVEVLPTEQACTTFNFLNGEGRMVAAAMIPPTLMSLNENDIARAQLDRKKIFEIED